MAATLVITQSTREGVIGAVNGVALVGVVDRFRSVGGIGFVEASPQLSTPTAIRCVAGKLYGV
jgi:hypothetical protein